MIEYFFFFFINIANSSASCSSRLIKKKRRDQKKKKKKDMLTLQRVSRKLGALKIVALACEPRFFGIHKLTSGMMKNRKRRGISSRKSSKHILSKGVETAKSSVDSEAVAKPFVEKLGGTNGHLELSFTV